MGFPTRARLCRFAGLLILLCAALPFFAACGKKARVATPPRPAPAPSGGPAPPPAAATPAAVPEPAPARDVVRPSDPPPAAKPVDPAAGPPIRIGLGTAASEVRISSQGGYFFQEKTAEASREAVAGEVQLRVETGPEGNDVSFRVQVAALSRAEAAEDLRRRLESRFGLPAVVREGPGGALQVRVGAFDDRVKAQEFASGRLAEGGYPGGFVVRESSPPGDAEARVAMRGPENLFRVQRSGFLFFPAGRDSFLRLDGKPYRGIIDITLNSGGRLTIVNQLGMEEYLRGVVPAEMSPTTYAEPAALAAQAVAARTFALRNAGKYRSEGFDLTNDVRSQVYGGVAAERPLTDEAVRATSGFVLYYRDQPIDAMYSSTCGGRTEDFENVFDSRPVPYLKGVACAEGDNASGAVGVTISGEHELEGIVTGHDGTVVNHELELARVLGWCDSLSLDYLSSQPSPGELRDWTAKARRLSGASGAPPESAAESGMLTNAGFLRYAAERVFGEREIALRSSERDVGYFLGNLKDGDQVPIPSRRALAFLVQGGLWRPYPDNTVRPLEKVTRATALSLLVRWGGGTRQELLRQGVLASAGDRLLIRSGTRSQEFELADRVPLFKMTGEAVSPMPDLRVIGNERLLFHVAPDGKIDFLQVELNPAGAASDRFSPAATWQASLSRRDLNERLRPLAPSVGEVLDIRPAKIGTSGRAVRIEVIGTRGTAELNGYRVRAALGLRDTLFTISRAVGLDGRNETFRFSGRGWGHGIGLCQVGAFGMARAGKSWEEIVRTYYTGVDIRRAY